MLFLGYDGAVDPTKYLDAWKRLEDIRILPAVPLYATQSQAGSGVQRPGPRRDAAGVERHSRPRAASILGRSARAMRAPVAVESRGSSIGQLPTPLPVLDRA